MTSTIFHQFYTVIMFIIFIGICVWAWHRSTRARFEEAARLPFADDDADMIPQHTGKEDNHE